MIKLGLIGAGNIIQSRHLPALKKNSEFFEVFGIVDRSSEKAKKIAEKYAIPNYHDLSKGESLKMIPWINEIDAAIVGTPPFAHEKNTRDLLELGKHVLVEKPFVLDLKVGKKLIDLAKKKKLILAVNHNFQFSSSFMKLSRLLSQNKFGKIRSFSCVQITNDKRRLPVWAEQLPMGLFYDETPHAVYLIQRLIDPHIKIQNVYSVRSSIKKNTPQILDIQINAGSIPGNISINFESPVCEWDFVIFGQKSLAIIDLFRDILTILPNDGQHLGKEVLLTSFLATKQHWLGFIQNGLKYARGQLYYGIDITQKNFYDAIIHKDNKYTRGMTGEDGLYVNTLQHQIIKATK